MMRLLLRRCTLLACLLAASSALAQPAAVAERYSLFPASADGIGKRYMGREISAVMGWQGAAWLEREDREREERTDLLLPMLEIKSGMAVADVGAGSGYFARRLAARVGLGGAVYAVDVQPEMVRMIMLPVVIKAAVAWADWGKYLGDNTMATTILDRLMHRAQVLEFEAKSYRLKEAANRLTGLVRQGNPKDTAAVLE